MRRGLRTACYYAKNPKGGARATVNARVALRQAKKAARTYKDKFKSGSSLLPKHKLKKLRNGDLISKAYVFHVSRWNGCETK